MISTEKQASAIEALHSVILVARAMGYLNEPSIDIARVLDVAEYLIVLLMKPEDTTAEFRECLESLAQQRDLLQTALLIFDRAPE